MKLACNDCGKMTALPADDWAVRCPCGYLLIGQITPGMKYVGIEGDEAVSRLPETDVMMEYKGNFYAIDNKVAEIRYGQPIYGSFRVEGIIKERLEELTDVRIKMRDMKKNKDKSDQKLASKEKDLEELQVEVEKAKTANKDKENALGVLRTELQTKEASLTEAFGRVKDCEAEIGRRALEKTTLQADAQKKLQAAERRAKKFEEELKKQIEEAAKEIEQLQTAVSTANAKNEEILAEKDEYKRKMQQEKEDMKKDYKTQMAKQKEDFDRMYDEMDNLEADYKLRIENLNDVNEGSRPA